MRYLDGLDTYLEELEGFVDFYDLPDEWFAKPDHVAIKCADADDYEAAITSFEPEAEQISYIELDSRRLATVQLASPLMVASFGSVSWVEVMEPRPEKVGNDVVGFEHMEFTFPDFAAARDILGQRNIAYTEQSNPGHKWLNIILNDKGQELKLNNRPLAAIVQEELETGQATLL